MAELELHVGFGQRRQDDPLHWMLILRAPDDEFCTWYHVTGGPSQGTDYTLMIQGHKRFKSFGIASTTLIGTVPETETNKIKAAAQAVPLQRCQRWTVAVLDKLEKKNLVPAGTSAKFEAQVEPSKAE